MELLQLLLGILYRVRVSKRRVLGEEFINKVDILHSTTRAVGTILQLNLECFGGKHEFPRVKVCLKSRNF